MNVRYLGHNGSAPGYVNRVVQVDIERAGDAVASQTGHHSIIETVCVVLRDCQGDQ